MSDVNGYGQYCPITRAVEVLGERWSMLILRDMLVGATRFNDISRGNPRLSRSLLSKRLGQLEQAGVIEHVDDEYLLTQAGEDLRSVVLGLGEWGAKWQFGDPRDSELDPELLMWWIHGRLDYSQMPDRRLVFEFRFSDQPQWFWILKDSQGPSICMHDPGFGGSMPWSRPICRRCTRSGSVRCRFVERSTTGASNSMDRPRSFGVSRPPSNSARSPTSSPPRIHAEPIPGARADTRRQPRTPRPGPRHCSDPAAS
jgi:DNA-binding HxlR family transcriptional regulator